MSLLWLRFAAVTLSPFVLATLDAGAQEQETRGWSLYPSAEVAAVYDDNLFFRETGTRGGTVYGRYGATVSANHQGARSRFSSSYSVRGEYFTGENEDLTEPLASQAASVSLSAPLGGTSALSAGASYQMSRSPEDVFDPVGIELGRRRAEGYAGFLGFTRQLSTKHSFGAQYSYAFRELQTLTGQVDPFDSIYQSASANWNHALSERTTGTLRYGFRVFENQRSTDLPGLNEPLQSHVVTYGFSRQISSRADISLHAGPNYYENFVLDPSGQTAIGKDWALTAEVGASFGYHWQKTSFDLNYGRSQNQFVGTGGRVTTDRVSLSLTYDPTRILSLSFSPSAQRNYQSGLTFDTYRANARASLQIARWLSLYANYRYAFQERFFGFAGEEIDLEPGARSRNQAYVGIVIGKTVPLE